MRTISIGLRPGLEGSLPQRGSPVWPWATCASADGSGSPEGWEDVLTEPPHLDAPCPSGPSPLPEPCGPLPCYPTVRAAPTTGVCTPRPRVGRIVVQRVWMVFGWAGWSVHMCAHKAPWGADGAGCPMEEGWAGGTGAGAPKPLYSGAQFWESENSKFEPAFPGCYAGVFVSVGEWDVFWQCLGWLEHVGVLPLEALP